MWGCGGGRGVGRVVGILREEWGGKLIRSMSGRRRIGVGQGWVGGGREGEGGGEGWKICRGRERVEVGGMG